MIVDSYNFDFRKDLISSQTAVGYVTNLNGNKFSSASATPPSLSSAFSIVKFELIEIQVGNLGKRSENLKFHLTNYVLHLYSLEKMYRALKIKHDQDLMTGLNSFKRLFPNEDFLTFRDRGSTRTFFNKHSLEIGTGESI